MGHSASRSAGSAGQRAAPAAAPHTAARQVVSADVGRERAAYTLEAHIDVQAAAAAQTLHLVALDDTALVSSTVDGLGDARVDVADNAVVLVVGAAFMGTAAWYFFLLNSFKVPFSINLGLINSHSISLNLKLLPAVLAGALFGRALLPHINQRIFEIIALGFALVAGIRLLFF